MEAKVQKSPSLRRSIEDEISMRRGPEDESSSDEGAHTGSNQNSKKADEANRKPAQPLRPQPQSSGSEDDAVPHGSAETAIQAIDMVNGYLTRIQMLYCRKVERFPVLFLVGYILILIAVIAALFKPLQVDTDFESLMRADGDASLNRDTYLSALNSKKKDEGSGRRLTEQGFEFFDAEDEWTKEQGFPFSELEDDWINKTETAPVRKLTGRLYKRYELHIIYKALEGNMLSEKTLRAMRDAEQKLRSMPMWKSICHTKVHEHNRYLCEPGESISNYVWPSPVDANGYDSKSQHGMDSVLFKVNFDGLGREQIPLPAVLALLDATSQSTLSRFFPKGFEADTPDMTAQVIQSHFTFLLEVGSPADSASVVSSNLQVAKQDYNKFVAEDLFPALNALNDDEGTENDDGVRIFYNGHVISSFEIYYTLERDVMFAIGSMAVVTAYMWLHTRSISRSIFCLITIFASIPFAFVMTPASKFTIASFLSLFLIIGMGSDVMFIFTDFWTQADGLPMHARLSWTLTNAVKSCAATSITTSASFFANLASVLRPLREFGFFMGMCVFGSFLLVSLLYPPFLVISEQRGCGCRKKSTSQVVDSSQNLSIIPAEGGSPNFQGSASTTKQSRMDRLLSKVVGMSLRYRKLVIFLAGAWILIFIICTSMMAKLDTGLPEIFPKDHNQNEGQAMLKKFTTTSFAEAPNINEAAACAPFTVRTEQEHCVLHWCDSYFHEMESKDDAEEEDSAEDETKQCHCFGHWHWHSLDGSNGANSTNEAWRYCSQIDMYTRVAGVRNQPELDDLTDLLTKRTVTYDSSSSAKASPFYLVQITGSGKQLPQLALENWESGQIHVENYIEAPHLSFIRNQGLRKYSLQSNKCTLYNMCTCGPMSCNIPVGKPDHLGSFNRPIGRRLDQPTLMPTTIALHKQTGVDVVFGLRTPQHIPLLGELDEKFTYDPLFEANNPWAQRAMMNLCTNLPPDLQVTSVKCWPLDFKRWLEDNNKDRFPTRQFQKYIIEFSQSDVLHALHFWIKGERLLAAKISFLTNIPIDAPVNVALRFMGRWNDFMESRNREASVTANRAWHTSRLWLRAEAETAIVDSTKDTILISMISGFIGMLCFTQDFTLSFMVVLLVMGIIAGLAFTMVVIMGWSVGPIEVLSLVIFVGYSVTYSLHVAHNYSEVEHGRTEHKSPYSTSNSEDDPNEDESTRSLSREERVSEACRRIGGAMVGSAISTLGSAFFLFFCTMVVFVKMGLVIFAVTALSITFALVVLPAMLATCGPSKPWSLRRLLCMGLPRWFQGENNKNMADDDNLDGIVPGRPVQ
jgi:predicted RND superfamily exporter protein